MITIYNDSYKEEVIKLILHVQNVEYEVGISVKEQPDILDIHSNYINDGGNFWIALNDSGEVVGSIGLQKKNKDVAVLKKFFVYKDYRGKEFGTGKKLYEALLDFAKKQGFSKIILDTPSKATRSHGFYKKVGFKEIDKEDLPIKYDYPDRNSIIFLLEL
ncbi:N-acetylglutamate synthase-like GNAT family acetyltransferase [Fontibacillus solani]|uniref:N-acetylglutamate synthase-like GNAT family acetyltransferase n=1 Tax=Fontibacillus solani TaxID=1572857 RepID=A0A7W3SUV4_9BACL|nr:GNAT family N-acetyltransferase [Fontibacillus solani]MBA9086563.1 N-acetylglutamate synthase-like GNAT family acetyltransferase [Fontibacillus solani]